MEQLKEENTSNIDINNQLEIIDKNISLLENTLDSISVTTFVDGCKTNEALFWVLSDMLGELIKHKKRLQYAEKEIKESSVTYITEIK